LLAERGWAICNGGHEGTMEAAAWGAKDAGGRTIGVSIEMYRPAVPNRWLDEEIVAESLFARLERLVTLGDAYVVLRGGIGTLLEFVLVWNLLQSRQFAHKPVIVIGADWKVVADTFHERLPMHAWEWSSIILVDTVDDAVQTLERRFAHEAASSPDN
jgi:uncharacterized protein (TIGR00725 family)